MYQTPGIQDIPLDGILIGSANTKNDSSWEYTWNAFPYYLLRNNQEYMVKAILPDGIYTKVSFRYQCPVPAQYIWVTGQISNTELSCYPPNNTLQFSGNTYVATGGDSGQLKLIDLPDAGTQEILIGSTNTRNDGSYEYILGWNRARIYAQPGQEYSVKTIFPDSGMSTRAGFRYECSDTENKWQIYGRTSNPVLSCSPPDNTIRFMGYTGPAVPPGTPVQLKLFHLPDSDTREILLGVTHTNNDGTWEYTWDGNAPGYSLREVRNMVSKQCFPGDIR